MKILSISDVVVRTNLSRSTIYELCKKGNFPKQIPLTPRRVGWIEEMVDGWIRAKCAAVTGISVTA